MENLQLKLFHFLTMCNSSKVLQTYYVFMNNYFRKTSNSDNVSTSNYSIKITTRHIFKYNPY